MSNRSPGPPVKDKKQYEALRDEGASNEKAARIANASANEGRGRSVVGAANGAAYEERTKAELL